MSDHSTSSAASPRGREAMQRILRAALAVFGRVGYSQATTRRIAADAGVSLPSIKYYFESKQGLYLACAREIVDRYESEAGEFVRTVATDLESGCSPDDARGHLKRVMRSVSSIAGGDDADLRTAFVLQEIADRGPAFDLLYRELWRPGMLLTAALVARIEGKARPDRESHVEALMLHASLTAFTATRPVSERYLAETDTSPAAPDDRDDALTVLDARIDRLGH